MEKNTSAPVSTEAIIETLRLLRDRQLAELIRSDDALLMLLNKSFDTVALSVVKKEFLRRDLLELQKSSLDLVHYSTLIKQIRDNGGLELAAAPDYFIRELNPIFRKYIAR